MEFAAIIEAMSYYRAYRIIIFDPNLVLLDQFASLYLSINCSILNTLFILTVLLCSNLSKLSKSKLIFTIDYLTEFIHFPEQNIWNIGYRLLYFKTKLNVVSINKLNIRFLNYSSSQFSTYLACITFSNVEPTWLRSVS